ncbi:MAG: hypothetical protein HY434_01065 [Candidatus Liptonbacteria bacterium]|nr:hypothetical protein [Candidatus Niyogibacteria bacterium]MBI4087404.1 hypothetical protein [Candidatus Liptonbacteria bacterium]
MPIFDRIKKFNLPVGQYAVFGSALLDVWGIRKAADLDIIVTTELYERLKSEGWEEKQANGFPMLSRDDANVTTMQDRPTDGSYCPDRLQLIKDAVIIEGIPFVRVEEVIACKKAYNRPKDIVDIAALEKHLNSTIKEMNL